MNPGRVPSAHRSVLHGSALLLVAFVGCTERPEPVPASPPVVAGLVQAEPDARVRGLVLLGELGCVACHAQTSDLEPADVRQGPDLATVGSRVRTDHLARFLAHPHEVEPGTVMPDLLRDRDERTRDAAAEALAHYLRSFAGPAAASEPVDGAAAARGRQLFHELGCAACHAPRDDAGEELPLPGSEPLGRLQDKYSLPALRAFLLAPLDARPAARMPDLRLSPKEAHDLASYLVAGPAAPPVPAPAAVEPARVAAGRTLFAELGCAHCHRLDDPARAPSRPAKPLRDLDPARGCLSGAAGPWPFHALDDQQRADLVAALRAGASPPTDEQRIRARLAARNCLACHQRDGYGGIRPDRTRFFTTSDESLGQEGRVPPPLTGVGAKLQRDWLLDAIAHGQSVRPYLRTRMPGFGAPFAAGLADLLARTDSLPPAALSALPADEAAARAVVDLGRELVGEKGMNCITCHAFAGERAGTMGGIDLVDSTAQRLRPEWFHHFLRDTVRFKPGTLMPQFFPDGVSVRPTLGDGDAAHQIDAIWHYLAGGRNVARPSGMRRPPIELAVGRDAVILRRSVQDTGKRGIAVGLPLGVNLTFDAERLGLNQVWWGRFVDAAPVWTGQGSGAARILGTERVTLPNGPAFAVLPEPDAPWPTATRRELGHQFLGYDLDARQRPAFRYTCAGVTITDAPVDVPGEAADGPPPRALLRRTLTFTGTADTTLQFLAARDARIDDLGDGQIRVGTSLRLRVPPGSFRIRRSGETLELRIAIALRDGRAGLVVDYRWQEQTR